MATPEGRAPGLQLPGVLPRAHLEGELALQRHGVGLGAAAAVDVPELDALIARHRDQVRLRHPRDPKHPVVVPLRACTPALPCVTPQLLPCTLLVLPICSLLPPPSCLNPHFRQLFMTLHERVCNASL